LVVLPLKKYLKVLSISLGDYTLEDILTLDSGGNVPEKQSLAGLKDDDLKVVLELKEDFQSCIQIVDEIKTSLRNHTDEAFDGFNKFLLPYLRLGADIYPGENGFVDEAGEEGKEVLGMPVPSSENFAAHMPVGKALSVQNRDDVNSAIELICEYYSKHEPSSPVPLFMQRAQKFVKSDFRTIVDELNLGGDMDVIFGVKDE
jgi:hypothetical protein